MLLSPPSRNRAGNRGGLPRRAPSLPLLAAGCLLLSGCCLDYDYSVRLPGTREQAGQAMPADPLLVQSYVDAANTSAFEAAQAASLAGSAETSDATDRATAAAESAAAAAAAASTAAQNLAACPEPPPPPALNFLGIRFDSSDKNKRAARAACPTADPCSVPSFSELRKAKAEAVANQEIKDKHGDAQVTPDGGSSNPSEVKFVAAPGALAIRFTAMANLNAFDGIPHALVLIIYQLSDRTYFDQLANNPDGIRSLLAMQATDPSVKSARQMFIQPGASNIMSMDRAEGGRYVALVAGYDRPDPAAAVFVAAYPIGRYAKKNGPLKKSTEMFYPMPLNLQVNLGPNGMNVSQTGEIFHNLEDAEKKAPPKNYPEFPQTTIPSAAPEVCYPSAAGAGAASGYPVFSSPVVSSHPVASGSAVPAGSASAPCYTVGPGNTYTPCPSAR